MAKCDNPVEREKCQHRFARVINMIKRDTALNWKWCIDFLTGSGSVTMVTYDNSGPLGMKDGRIFKIGVSSVAWKNDTYAEESVRLDSSTCWIPEIDEVDPVIRVEVSSGHFISGLITQGCGDRDDWVTAYKVEYDDDGNFKFVIDNDGNEMVSNELISPGKMPFLEGF